ncbi:cytochrome P450 [Mycena galopus ATCC 62051]|nr:cytochrome P450 [Mycena galopus ATCC 62051]
MTLADYLDEPPLEAGWIPWLGAGLQMRKMEEFAVAGYKKHGHTFAAYAAGQRFVFSEDLAVHRSVVTSKDFGHNELMVQIQQRFLGAERPTTAEEEAACVRVLHTQLAGRPLAHLRTAFLEHLITAIDGYKDLGVVDLMPLLRETIFTCTLETGSFRRAIFGRNFPAEEALRPFEAWDRGLQNLISGTKDDAAVEGRRVLEELVGNYLRDNILETEPVIQGQWNNLEQLGAPFHLRVKFVALGFMWAAAANVAPVSSWAMAFIYNDPALAARLRSELAAADKSLEQEAMYEIGAPSAQWVAQEAIRLTMLGSIVRPAACATTIESTFGPVRVRKGDLMMCTSWSMHRRFENPEEFIWDRLKPVPGEDLSGQLYMAFGGGLRPCVGKSFAYTEIKMLTLAMLERYDVEPVTPFPRLVKTDRIGVGTMEPSHAWKNLDWVKDMYLPELAVKSAPWVAKEKRMVELDESSQERRKYVGIPVHQVEFAQEKKHARAANPPGMSSVAVLAQGRLSLRRQRKTDTRIIVPLSAKQQPQERSRTRRVPDEVYQGQGICGSDDGIGNEPSRWIVEGMAKEIYKYQQTDVKRACPVIYKRLAEPVDVRSKERRAHDRITLAQILS